MEYRIREVFFLLEHDKCFLNFTEVKRTRVVPSHPCTYKQVPHAVSPSDAECRAFLVPPRAINKSPLAAKLSIERSTADVLPAPGRLLGCRAIGAVRCRGRVGGASRRARAALQC